MKQLIFYPDGNITGNITLEVKDSYEDLPLEQEKLYYFLSDYGVWNEYEPV